MAHSDLVSTAVALKLFPATLYGASIPVWSLIPETDSHTLPAALCDRRQLIRPVCPHLPAYLAVVMATPKVPQAFSLTDQAWKTILELTVLYLGKI